MKKNKKQKTLKSLLSMKNKNALIIGGAGYLGEAMSETLLELGSNLIIAERYKKVKIIKKLKKTVIKKSFFILLISLIKTLCKS